MWIHIVQRHFSYFDSIKNLASFLWDQVRQLGREPSDTNPQNHFVPVALNQADRLRLSILDVHGSKPERVAAKKKAPARKAAQKGGSKTAAKKAGKSSAKKGGAKKGGGNKKANRRK